MTLDEEKQLVLNSKTDPESFAKLYEDNFNKILNYAVHRTGNIEIAKDIVSETFYKALRNLWKYQWKDISFSAWLYKIATNEINLHYRKLHNRIVSIEELTETKGIEFISEDNVEDIVLAQEELETNNQQFLYYSKKIAEMPIKYQEVLTLRYFEEKSIKEICNILGKGEGTVKSLLHRGIEKLKILNKI